MPRTQPPQQPPPVMRLLVRYGKLGRSRFASHRDFARCFERALRRAEIPMAYSSGFNPHQRVSYVNPAATGAESDAEFLVIALRQACDPADVRTRLGAAMPDGFPILEVTPVPRDASFEASLWLITLPGATREALARAALLLDPLTSEEVLVTRETKNGPRTFDVCGPVDDVTVTADARLLVIIRHTEPLVRPDDVVTALRAAYPELDSDDPPRFRRLAQGAVPEMIPPERYLPLPVE